MNPKHSIAIDKLIQLENAVKHDLAPDVEFPAERLEQLKKALDEFVTSFKEEMAPRHGDQYEQIRDQDIALQPRIRAMQQEDERLIALMGDLQCAIGEIDDSTVTNARIVRVSNQVRGLITDVRAQSDRLSRWFSESLLRDRG